MTERVIPADFTLDQLLAELRQAEQGPADYRTQAEWRGRLGISQGGITRLLREAKGRGILRVARVRREALDGTSRWVPAYGFETGQG